jgi:3-deoxy-D-manno-octulosonic-acid transferase
MRALVQLVTGAYHAGIALAAPFHAKARQWVDGRKGVWERLEQRRDQLQGCLWMHCASVGEFEQGRPVLEAIKAAHPDLPVLLTFFSPSGHEAFKHHPLATHVDYLPPDTAANARRFLRTVRPSMAVFVKYEFWYHHLTALRREQVPSFLLAAVFRPGQPFFRWYGAAHRTMARSFTHIFTQDEGSARLLRGIGIVACTVAGDTRYDRVADIVALNEELSLAARFKGDHPLVVCGSTWPADERLLMEAGVKGKYLVAPHELDDAHLQAVERAFPKPLARWSELEGGPLDNVGAVLGAEPEATLVVDRMGLLARLYKYADVAYVGGGFGDGIHNLLEAAAWGVPVVFGPNHRKFIEAQGLIDAGAGFAVRSAPELRRVLRRLLGDAHARRDAAERARRFVAERTGATERVVEMLSAHLRAFA